MWWFKTELKEDLLQGRTIKYVSKQIEVSLSLFNRLLNGKIGTQKSTAFYIVKSCRPDKELEDYFYKIK